jgi:hypothetical protein
MIIDCFDACFLDIKKEEGKEEEERGKGSTTYGQT